MNAEFQAWVFVLGLACGAALAWLALGSGELPDPDAGATDDASGLEAEWIARELQRRGQTADGATIAGTLELHEHLVHGRPLPPPRPAWSNASGRADEDRLPE